MKMTIINIKLNEGHSDCMHENCSACGGTGQKKDGSGICIHAMSCPCPKCSPRC